MNYYFFLVVAFATATAQSDGKGRRIVFEESNGAPEPLYSEEQPEIEEGSAEDLKNLQWVMVTSEGLEYTGTYDEVKAMLEDDEDGALEDLEYTLSSMESAQKPGDDVDNGQKPKPGMEFDDVDNGQKPKPGKEFEEDVEELGKRSVIPPDGRVRIIPRGFPYTAIGYIDVGCTGSFVRSRSVLTMGHCVYNRAYRRWYSNLNIRRAKNCGRYGGYYHVWKRAASVIGYTLRGLAAYDYGMIFYRTNSPVWFGFGYHNGISINWGMYLTGYAADRYFCLYRSVCLLRAVTPFQLKHTCDTSRGMSGSGMLVPRAHRYHIIHGIHGYYGYRCYYHGAWRPCNAGTRINRQRFFQFIHWIRIWN